jgi:hypothetical protein
VIDVVEWEHLIFMVVTFAVSVLEKQSKVKSRRGINPKRKCIVRMNKYGLSKTSD